MEKKKKIITIRVSDKLYQDIKELERGELSYHFRDWIVKYIMRKRMRGAQIPQIPHIKDSNKTEQILQITH